MFFKTNQSVLKGPHGAPMDLRGHPKTSQGVFEDPQGDPKGSQGRPAALSKDTPGPRGRPSAPPKIPKVNLGELWQVSKIIEKPKVFLVCPATEAPLDDLNSFATF